MSDKPILFSAPMVRALLDGRKTMTRSLLKPKSRRNPLSDYEKTGRKVGVAEICELPLHRLNVSPYAVGDRLWVREAFSDDPDWGLVYRATAYDEKVPPSGWKLSIHMPRWASRLTLTVTATKVERLQEISEEDARAEGSCAFAESLDRIPWGNLVQDDRDALVRSSYGSLRRAFCHLWESIHGPGSWDANPWVSAITFTVERNIDA